MRVYLSFIGSQKVVIVTKDDTFLI